MAYVFDRRLPPECPYLSSIIPGEGRGPEGGRAIYLEAEKVRLSRDDDGLAVTIDGVSHRVERIAKAFPETNPDSFIGLQDPTGHEIGMIRNSVELDEASLKLLQEELEVVYFVPTILEIRSVEQRGAGRILEVATDVGDQTFRIIDRNALNGKKAPAVTVTDSDGRRYRIPDFWALDRESRKQIQDLLPLKVLKSREARRRW